MSVKDLQGEIWKDVVIDSEVYPYQISNYGRIKSLLRTNREKLLKQCKDKDGYLLVGLYREKGSKPRTFKVHRLVAFAFLENPNNLLEINHLDEDKSNNCASNLCFCTRKQNLTHGSRIERIIKKRKETIKTSAAWKEGRLKTGAKLSKKVFQYTTDGKLVNTYPSLSEVQKKTGFATSAICNCCNKKPKYKTAYGFIWSYEPIETSSNQLTLFPLTEKKIS